MSTTTHIFVGPTLSAGEVQKVLPAACIHPPIMEGDINDHILNSDRVGIIDGLFYRVPSIRHKGILSAMRRGVVVFGASSMGALRAAELHSFGMHGVGAVFKLYATGIIDGDDEVAVTHAHAEDEWAQITLPLVSVRVALSNAVRAGRCSRKSEESAISAIKRLPFFDRSMTAVRICMRQAGIAAAEAEQILQTVRVDDVKRRDAVELLHKLASMSAGRERPISPRLNCCESCGRDCGRAETHFQITARWAALQEDGVPRLQNMIAAQVVLREYPAIYRRAALAVISGLPAVTPADVMAERALTVAESRGVLLAGWPRRDTVPASMRTFLRPAECQSWAQAARRRELVLTALVRSCRVAPGVPPTWLAYDLLTDEQRNYARQAVKAAQRMNASRLRQSPEFSPDHVSATAAKRAVYRLWGQQPDSVSVRDRGFIGMTPVINAARLFAAYVLEGGLDVRHKLNDPPESNDGCSKLAAAASQATGEERT